MVARSFQAVDVEICPICGRTGDYEGLRGNLVELVHDPLGLELLMNGTIRNQVVRFEDDQRDVAGITAVRDRLAVQQQVFPAMTGDREHVADWRDRAERSAFDEHVLRVIVTRMT